MLSGLHVYIFLILLRIFSAFSGNGYIHPDEYFQNGEVAAGVVLDWKVFLSWEWSSPSPVRSIVTPLLTTGLPFKLLTLLNDVERIRPTHVFLVERLSFLLQSFLIDWSIYRIASPGTRGHALFLAGSSYVLHTFQLRPFSNSIEAVFVASSLVALRGLIDNEQSRQQATQKIRTAQFHLCLLAVLLSIGLFVRITFVAFVAPVVFEALLSTLRVSRPTKGSQTLSLTSWLTIVTPSLITALGVSGCIIYADTVYFKSPTLVLTPWNFLQYNLSPENLAEHGLHPRWLHLVVNLPMIVGPGLLYYGVSEATNHFRIRRSKKRAGGPSKTNVEVIMRRTYIRIILLSLTLLSLQPHQEPRFLVPLLVPFVLLASNRGQIAQAGRIFWASWIISNILLTTLFGYLHQGGVVPSVLYLHGRISASPIEKTEVFYWKTYMPPRHLLGISAQNTNISLTDLAGSSDLVRHLFSSVENATTRLYLVAPPYFIKHNADLSSPNRECFVDVYRVWPYLDLDHISESVQAGWRDGLSLGVYDVDTDCILKTNSQ